LKKRLLTYLLPLLCWHCESEQLDDCFTPYGKIQTESRTLPSFDKLELYGRVDLDFYSANEYKAMVETGKNLMEQMITEVKEGKLIIRNKNTCNWVRSYNKPLKVHLYAPLLREFLYYGSGTVQFMDTLMTDEFYLQCWEASGNVCLRLKTPHAEIKSHTGPTDITVSGEADYLVTYMNGNGNIFGSELRSIFSLAVNTNTGNIHTWVRDSLEAEIKGKGDIIYRGKPGIKLGGNGSGELKAF
jgi:hypothetical protein